MNLQYFLFPSKLEQGNNLHLGSVFPTFLMVMRRTIFTMNRMWIQVPSPHQEA